MSTASGSRAQSARRESIKAERIAPGMFRVTNRTSDSEYIVDVRDGACLCRDFEYAMGPSGGLCKHLEYIRQVSSGVLCPHCGYSLCRPSCPKRGERNE